MLEEVDALVSVPAPFSNMDPMATTSAPLPVTPAADSQLSVDSTD